MKSQLIFMALASLVASAPLEHQQQHHKHEKRAVVTQTVTVAAGQTAAAGSAQAVVTSSAAPASVASSAAASASSSSSSYTSGASGDLSSFKDGTIKCSEFPSGDGVVSVSWLGFGGWSSIMNLQGGTSESCENGYYCSYACEAGYSKTQWPSNQPSDGRSVGGLLCKDGLLYRSNTAFDTLCVPGKGTASVENNVSKGISICRTDYPGSENMCVPTWVDAGNSNTLTVVDEDNYYEWQGLKTSAQYYVNNAGVSVEDGCIWGDESSGVGNWAPLVLGAGSTGGLTYLSLIPNPNNKKAPNFNVKIVATDGSSINGDCKYENGIFVGSSTDGCTVTVTSGSAKLVFY
ncbi:Cell wall biogenesis involved protein [Komagataella phaffii CBS 7435]|uniref:Mitochondrial outer membrane and cell wall localized SUN family member n=2 Tax=Komagataella phaffii TaxID=460519 RepID=C4R6P9_KOMPG|nr:Mitochondrial outer membrane and cell wall localized SUN family member [Komagataella phaffii GS115]AOA64497.1 GQ67_04355T0 [Komagataella phaffii]CAH2451384.1 Cell wall biogenesis involved protein [Komagataella phaffii CBS 7435]AOA69961.1 GQ68_04327T0 [Komagataella phaffii GS115]CAY71274.1 Mitochondrial outer membrane and cell wall localized SUN family member [Komagataella phaffii GS115]CCA41119.1 Cell wall biogenesis involved protein [Komagataella phaffii CBS 7435]